MHVDIPLIGRTIQYQIGQNAQDNFDIIDAAKPDDLWFHLYHFSSSHVVASMPENLSKKEKSYIAKQGAVLCKQNSKFKSGKDIEIIYTPVCNVVKSIPIGSVHFMDETKTKKIKI